MLENIVAIENLRGLARAKSQEYETKTVHLARVDEALLEGWVVDKKNIRSVRLRRKKTLGNHLKDRIWSLLYRMGFTHLSVDPGASLVVNPKQPELKTIDVLGIDNEISVAIESKFSERISSRSQLQEEIRNFVLMRERLSNSIATQYETPFKRQVAMVMFVANISLSEADRVKAKQSDVILFEERDLTYYETLIDHIGPAAKYQFFADMLPGKTVPGLAIRIPAVRTKMGGVHCYTFSISPEYLLKISYVSHRSKGMASDVNTYQRMISKSRLAKIKEYISDDGVFPTNIVVNLENKRVRFERVHQEKDQSTDTDGGVLGWLDIRPAYKSAWIIDGQHRLFAYSGHEKANSSLLSVLAFEGLTPSKQAELFIDINAKQKSVKQSLLQELYAELHWDADDPAVRIRAIVSKSIQVLDATPDSAFYKRIQTADAEKDTIRCISLRSIYDALEKIGFYISKEKQGHIIEYGPLWAGSSNATLKRTVYILMNWFDLVTQAVPDWWNKGSGEGGGIAMNDGVITCINVLRSVVQHLDSTDARLLHLNDENLFHKIKPYGDALGEYLKSLSEDSRKRFRELRGIQGQTTRTRRCQQAIHELIPSFNPLGLEEFLRLEKAETNKKAKEIVDRIETTLQKVILEELYREFGSHESQWWMMGVPRPVRLKVSQRFEEEEGKRGGKEYYFDLIDYRQIATHNWDLFEPILGYGKSGSGNKDKRTGWMNDLNEKRRIVSHVSSGVHLSMEELSQLEEYDRWLSKKLMGSRTSEKNE